MREEDGTRLAEHFEMVVLNKLGFARVEQGPRQGWLINLHTEFSPVYYYC